MKLKIGILLACLGLIIGFTGLYYYTTPLSVNKARESNRPIGFITKGKLYVQKARVNRNYIYGLELKLATWNRENHNTTQLVVFNNQDEILFQKSIKAEEIKDNQFHEISFGKSIFCGNEDYLFIGLYSDDGTNENSITMWCDTLADQGSLSVMHYDGGRLSTAIEQNHETMLQGSMCYNIHESSLPWSLKNILICSVLIILLASITLLYFIVIRRFSPLQKLKPEIVFLCIALPFGISFMVFTKPFSAPDEPGHFLRAYQVSELNIFKKEQVFLSSIGNFVIDARKFQSHKMDSRILKEMSMYYPDSGKTFKYWTYDLYVPYIPQTIGISIGKMLNLSPLWLYNLGRLSNLLFAITLIYFAIKIIPTTKWMLVFIGLMPMSVYLFSTISHDAFTISFTFLLFSYILYLASPKVEKLKKKDFVVLILLILMSSLGKLPYNFIGLLFLIIPIIKAASRKKYIIYFAVLIIMLICGYSSFYFIRNMLNYEPLLDLPMVYTQLGDKSKNLPIILNDIPRFIGLIADDILFLSTKLYLIGCYGTFGKLEYPLSYSMTICFFICLILYTLTGNETSFRLKPFQRMFILMVFVMCIGLIMTASYLYFTPIGCNRIAGIQGRYFIPLLPLAGLSIYGLLPFFSSKVNQLSVLNRIGIEGKLKFIEFNSRLNKFLQFVLICFSVSSLLFSLAILYVAYF
jgi:uncharacterized membrane protein